MSSERRLLETHPHWPQAETVFKRLHAKGHKAYLAGGSVRDALRGVVAKDLDIATSATPDEIAALFDKTVDVGKSFGVMRVILGDADLEVATFRSDGDYRDGRRPESVHFSDEKEDAVRRDFTVNALFFDPLADRVIDDVDGKKDLDAKILRTVGDAEARFREDHLRILRAVRFAVQLGFAIEEKTWRAVRAKAADVKTVSRERVRDELAKMFKSGGGDLGPRLLEESGLLEALFPALRPFSAAIRAWAPRTLKHASATTAEALTRWMAPLGESGEQGRQAARDAVQSLRLSKEEERFILRALEISSDRDAFWTQAEGKRLAAYAEPAVRLMCDIWEGCGEDPRRRALDAKFKTLAPEGRLPDRLLRGDDLARFVQGAALGEALAAVYEAQLEGRFQDRAGALTWAEGWLKLKGQRSP